MYLAMIAFSLILVALGLSLFRDLLETQKDYDKAFEDWSEPKWR